MRPRFPDLPKRSRIVREDPIAEEAYFSNDISDFCQQGKLGTVRSHSGRARERGRLC
jgi:hypothetical protein